MSNSGSPSDSSGVEVRARIAIDLGAESCRVSLLRWHDGIPAVELIHRIPNGPVHESGFLLWPFDSILSGLEDGLRKAAHVAPEGIASIAVDGWAVDYVRLGSDGHPIYDPFCYRDERTIAAKQIADQLIAPQWMFEHTGAQPLRINTIYQLLADRSAGIENRAPWICLPEYVLYHLGGRRVAEYTNATHTGLVDLATGNWSEHLLDSLQIPRESLPPIVSAGTVIGKLQGPLTELAPFHDTNLIAPACHDTASAIAGICCPLKSTAYICSGTWSLVGTLVDSPITTHQVFKSGFTNQGAAGGGFCFHTNVNGMWILKQCLERWKDAGRPWDLPSLIEQASELNTDSGIVPVDVPSLLLDGDMPSRLNEQLRLGGFATIEDSAGNEPIFARVIFESLARRYATVLADLEKILGYSFKRIHILGGGSLNQLLTRLTSEYTGLPVETGNVESSAIGNFAVQLASAEARGSTIQADSVRKWAKRLCATQSLKQQPTSIFRN